MMRLVLPLILMVAGTGAGVGAGILLAPPQMADADTDTIPEARAGEPPASAPEPNAPTNEFVRLNNQFIVPLVQGGRIGAMMVLSLSVEVGAGQTGAVYAIEPRLRDGFLQVLFDHANRGGFDGEFTNTANMDVLRRLLLEVARARLGDAAQAVLITDIARQDV